MENNDLQFMEEAIAQAEKVRCLTSPNPWVGCVVVSEDGQQFSGATYEDGKNHAEIVAINKAGSKARGATAYVTLEPCCHQGKTPPCVDSIINAGIKKVVVGIVDPDKKVKGKGITHLEENGVEVVVGIGNEFVTKQLAPYIKQRSISKPYVVLKLAITVDGNIADKAGNSKWITGEMARADSHRLRAESDLVLVGANTVRQDDPSLTVRDWAPDINPMEVDINPKRVVIGNVDSNAKIQPCLEMSGDMKDIIAELSSDDVLQILVEGGSSIAAQLHNENLVDKYVIYLAPAILGGVGTNIFENSTENGISDLWRGEIESVRQLGSDIRIDIVNGNHDNQ